MHCFYTCRSKSVKVQSSRKYLFALLGSSCVKAADITLMKLTPVTGHGRFEMGCGIVSKNIKMTILIVQFKTFLVKSIFNKTPWYYRSLILNWYVPLLFKKKWTVTAIAHP